jgi:hypothetical protein
MLEFTQPTSVFLDHVQPRVELHGEEHVHAIDLSMTYTSNNRVLDAVAPGLRETLFAAHARQPAKAQGEMNLPVDDLPHLRAPALVQPLRLDCETEGATVVVSNGVKASTSIRLTECKVHKLRVTAIEGGSTEVKFSVSSASGIDAQVVGALSMKQQQEIELTLTGPKVEGQAGKGKAEAEGKGDVLWPFPGTPEAGSPAAVFNNPPDDKPAPVVTTKKRRKVVDATAIFAAQHGGEHHGR